MHTYADEAVTARHVKDGWFYPGDSGVTPQPGRLVVQGRESGEVLREVLSRTFVGAAIASFAPV